MIIRIGDSNNQVFDNDLQKIASKIENREKLYGIYADKAEALVVQENLKSFENKYSMIKEACGFFELYVINENVITKNDQLDGFKKIATNKYIFDKKASIGMLGSYNFDDGSIWVVSKDEEGNEILVKFVDEEDEEKILRKTKI